MKRTLALLCAAALPWIVSTPRAALCGETPPVAEAPTIKEGDLNRRDVSPSSKLPWAGKPTVVTTPKPSAAPANNPAPAAANNASNDIKFDLNASDLYMVSKGMFTIERIGAPGAPPSKDKMTMTKDVEINIGQSQVLRGQTVAVIQDSATHDVELLDAKGDVQMADDSGKGRGETLRVERQTNEKGELIKNQFMLVGDVPKKIPATLWLKKDPKDPSKMDVIQAFRFNRDDIALTFRASGAPTAILTLEPAPAPATPATPATPAPAENKGLAGLNLTSGGKISISCDADLMLDRNTGKLNVVRNAVMIKEAENPADSVRIAGDNAVITMTIPEGPPGATNAFGDMKMLECTGKVEIRTGARTILCDRVRIDMEKKFIYMEMNNSSDTVNVYEQESDAGGKVTIAPRTLKINMDDQSMQAGGPMKIKPFNGPPPSNRGNGPTQEEVMKASGSNEKKSSLFGDTKKTK